LISFEMSRFFTGGSSSEDEEGGSVSGEEEQQEKTFSVPGRTANKISGYQDFSEGEEEESNVKRVVRSTRDKRFEELANTSQKNEKPYEDQRLEFALE